MESREEVDYYLVKFNYDRVLELVKDAEAILARKKAGVPVARIADHFRVGRGWVEAVTEERIAQERARLKVYADLLAKADKPLTVRYKNQEKRWTSWEFDPLSVRVVLDGLCEGSTEKELATATCSPRGAVASLLDNKTFLDRLGGDRYERREEAEAECDSISWGVDELDGSCDGYGDESGTFET